MRDILFRGKDALTKEWIYGDFHHGGIDKETGERITFIKPFDKFLQEVIPETVGQYTGLTDKNDKKVFEGDIVLNGFRRLSVVKYDTKNAHFALYKDDKYLIPGFNADTMKLWEVIGNIHDRPEWVKMEV